MNGARGDKYVDAMSVRTFHRLVDFFDIARIATRKSADNRSEVTVSDRFDRFEVTG